MHSVYSGLYSASQSKLPRVPVYGVSCVGANGILLDCETKYKIAYNWQWVLNLAYCAP
jgi:hypothetical protein